MDLFLWWVVPGALVFCGFLAMIKHDGTEFSDLNYYALAIIIVSTLLWPMGITVLCTIAFDYFMRRRRADKLKDSRRSWRRD